jgi:hypothetical protein
MDGEDAIIIMIKWMTRRQITQDCVWDIKISERETKLILKEGPMNRLFKRPGHHFGERSAEEEELTVSHYGAFETVQEHVTDLNDCWYYTSVS